MTEADEDEDALAVIPAEATEGWAKVEAAKMPERMRVALRHMACGMNAREAATAAGYASHSDVYRAAVGFGFVDLRTKAIINIDRRISNLAGKEIERRLVDETQALTTPQLAVIKGISTDKVLAHDKAGTDDGASYMSAFEIVAEKLAKSGARLELTVSVRPAEPRAVAIEAETIDVTPDKEEQT